MAGLFQKRSFLIFHEENRLNCLYLFTLPFKYEESQNVPTFRGVLAHPPKKLDILQIYGLNNN